MKLMLENRVCRPVRLWPLWVISGHPHHDSRDFKSLSRFRDQIRPSNIKMTMMIKIAPMSPTPP